jgi:hypothetical protein
MLAAAAAAVCLGGCFTVSETVVWCCGPVILGFLDMQFAVLLENSSVECVHTIK